VGARRQRDAPLNSALRIEIIVPAESLDALAIAIADRLAPPVPAQGASDFLTVAEAAEFLRAKPQRVYDLLSDGRLTRYRDGRRVLIARDELHAYLRADEATRKLSRSSKNGRALRKQPRPGNGGRSSDA
jgi:excisionase family DNA binding protein